MENQICATKRDGVFVLLVNVYPVAEESDFQITRKFICLTATFCLIMCVCKDAIIFVILGRVFQSPIKLTQD